MTEAIVRAFRQDAGPFGCQLLASFGDLVELEAEQPTLLIDPREQQLEGGGGDGRFVPVGFCIWHWT